MRMFFVRHGQSEANVLGVFSNRGWRHGLTEEGRRQAEALAHVLQGQRFVAAYCSPAQRAVETAEIVGRQLDLACLVEPALREFDVGCLEGRSDSASWSLFHAMVVAWMQGQDREQGLPGGESYHDLEKRFLPFFGHLLERHEQAEGSVLLIGHGGTFRCMLPLVLANVDHAFSLTHDIGNTEYVLAEHRARTWVCLRWGAHALAGQDDEVS